MGETIIDFIRHGEPVGGRAFRGHRIDDPLSEKGWQQMRDAVDGQCPWSHIISSPMKRCYEFANEIAANNALATSIDDRLKEVGFGDWEGQTPTQLQAQRLEEYNAFYADPVNNRPPGAENLNSFILRVVDAYEGIVKNFANKHVLVVAHAGVIRAVISHVLHTEPLGLYKINIKNAGLTRICINQRGAMLEYLNHTL